MIKIVIFILLTAGAYQVICELVGYAKFEKLLLGKDLFFKNSELQYSKIE